MSDVRVNEMRRVRKNRLHRSYRNIFSSTVDEPKRRIVGEPLSLEETFFTPSFKDETR